MSSGYLNKPVRSLFEAALAKQLNGKAVLSDLTTKFDHHRDGVLITSTNLDEPGPEILYCNAALVALCGYEETQLIGHSPRLLQGPKTDMVTLRRFKKLLCARREAQMTITNYDNAGEEYEADILAGYVALADRENGVYVALSRKAGDRGPPLTMNDIIDC